MEYYCDSGLLDVIQPDVFELVHVSMSLRPRILIGCHPSLEIQHYNECLHEFGHLFLTLHHAGFMSACVTVHFLINLRYSGMILPPSDSTVPHARGLVPNGCSCHLSAAASSLLPIW